MRVERTLESLPGRYIRRRRRTGPREGSEGAIGDGRGDFDGEGLTRVWEDLPIDRISSRIEDLGSPQRKVFDD